jgi:hypothetical protein
MSHAYSEKKWFPGAVVQDRGQKDDFCTNEPDFLRIRSKIATASVDAAKLRNPTNTPPFTPKNRPLK